MIALASVDLPEPLGPMSAWTSPERTVRSTPLRICLSPAATWRFLISRSGMEEVSVRRGRLMGEGDELGQRGALQRAHDAALDAGPEELRGAAVAVVVVVGAEDLVPLLGVVDEARHRRDGALERHHRLVHADVLGALGQPVAAVRAAGRLD